jgi:SAM-dependent methyltransferase
VGIEVNSRYAEFANEEKNIRTYRSAEELDAAGEPPFDVVLHYYVLEHVPDPLAFLRDCLLHVRPGGKLLFEVPNAMDPLTSLYKVPEFEEFYWWRAHHWYFTPRSLGYLLKQLGRKFEIHPGQRYDLSNHMVWMAEGKPGGMGRYDHILSEETRHAYAEDLKRSGHCDHMIAIVS